MGKQIWRPGNMVYPLPAVMVTSVDGDGKPNIMTAAWTGTVCSDPAMAYVSIRKERYSHGLILRSGEYVINLRNKALVAAADYCGVKSGRGTDKFARMKLTAAPASQVSAPLIEESPVNIECRVREVREYGSHDMFVAEVLAVHADEEYMDEKGRFCLDKAGLVAYSHGTYYCLGKPLGTFGFSVKKQGSKQK
jgi:flavin reductase (DIM6/NTAB) family NADH-FMN oxidoreductase RutF